MHETRQLPDGDRERREPFRERHEVLLAQHGGGHEHRHLTALDRGLERRPNRKLRLAETDVAAHDTVHGPRRLHVALDLLEHELLVRRLLVRERSLQLLLPRAVGRVGVALRMLAARVQTEQLARHLLGALLHAASRALPLPRAEARELGMRVGTPDVPIHTIEMLCRDEEPIRLRVVEHHVLVLRAGVVGDRAHLDEPRDAVVAMDDEITGRELQDEGLSRCGAARCAARTARRRGDGPARAPAEHRTPPLDGAEQLGIRVHVDRPVRRR